MDGLIRRAIVTNGRVRARSNVAERSNCSPVARSPRVIRYAAGHLETRPLSHKPVSGPGFSFPVELDLV